MTPPLSTVGLEPRSSDAPPRALARPLPTAPLVLGRGRRAPALPRFPWALVAADALILHLLSLPRALGPTGLAAGVALLAYPNAAWIRRHRASREAASAIALRLWGLACGLGVAALAFSRPRLEDSDVVGIPIYMGATFAAIAMLERAWPRASIVRTFWVLLASLLAVGAHLAVTLPGNGGHT